MIFISLSRIPVDIVLCQFDDCQISNGNIGFNLIKLNMNDLFCTQSKDSNYR